jgi:CrcB protein
MSAGLWVAVAAVAGTGAVARFTLDSVIDNATKGDFPLGTLAINLIGSFLLGLLTGLGVTGTTLLIAGTALLGSFTTFSTWMLDTFLLAEEGRVRPAVVNVAISLLLGFGAALLGRTVGLHVF